ncbi:MAG: CDP-glucose 4,6-dehydratase [Veillonellales bacterium]
MESLVNDNNRLAVIKGKRVLITGDTGFKGSWLAMVLHGLGANVVGFALPPEHPNDHYNLLGLDRIIHHVSGDIRDLDSVMQVFQEFKPEFLFHLAAQPLVRFSYEQPKLTFDTNVGGSVNILEAIRNTDSLRSVIYVTTDKCYKNKEWIWGYRENDELGGRDPYSASKAAAELVFSAYLESFFKKREYLGVASVRAGNVIGGGDWALDRIVPDSIKALQSNLPIIIRNPIATRPWQHVLEPLMGYLMLAKKLYYEPNTYSGSWNFGPRVESIQTVHALVEKIICYWGQGEIQLDQSYGAPHEANLLQLNCDKAHQILKWSPIWDFDRTIRETVRWYKEQSNGISARAITESQIEEYMGELK